MAKKQADYPSISELIANYRKTFDLYAAYLEDFKAEKDTTLDYGARVSLENRLRRKYTDLGWDGSKWNWDADWDGLLISRAQALHDSGFVVVELFRKMQIRMLTPEKISRGQIVTRIEDAVGGTFTGVSFSRGLYVWWGTRTKFRY